MGIADGKMADETKAGEQGVQASLRCHLHRQQHINNFCWQFGNDASDDQEKTFHGATILDHSAL
ncbi:MAG: hypothetical protein HW380_3567 [Magnetococcales bacterium]|nr:hypothetical protein [Magnetococcales bacterium]